MDKILVLIAMIFFHILDDFHLQGILANMKQKSWWRNHPDYDPMYDYDYIVCLLAHGFQWTITMMLPVFAYLFMLNCMNLSLLVVIVVNTIIHAEIDHTKANLRAINLVQDQMLHMIQIVMTWMTFVL